MDVERKDCLGRTPLIAAAAGGWPTDFSELLIKKGAHVNTCDNQGITPLIAAAKSPYSSQDTAFLLIDHGADVNAHDKLKGTPLLYAATHRDLALPKRLIEKGAAINAIARKEAETDASWEEMTPLLTALAYKNLPLANYLLDRGAMLTSDHPYSLAFSVYSGCLRAVEHLVKQGADPNALSWNGRTPFLESFFRGHLEIASYLLQHGADCTLADYRGDSPLHAAIRYRDPTLLAQLIEKGAEVNATNNKGETALHWAAREGTYSQFSILVEKGADMRLKTTDYFPDTPLKLASYRDGEPMLQALVQRIGTEEILGD